MAWSLQPVVNVGLQVLLSIALGWSLVFLEILDAEKYMPQVNTLVLWVGISALNGYHLGLKLELRDAEAWRALGAYLLWIVLAQLGIGAYVVIKSYTRCAAVQQGPHATLPLPGDEPLPAAPEPTATLAAEGGDKDCSGRPDAEPGILVTHASVPTTTTTTTAATPSTSTNSPAGSTATNGEATPPHLAKPPMAPPTITATRTATAAAAKSNNSTTAVEPQAAAAAAAAPGAAPEAAQGLGRMGLLREFALLSLVLTANNCGMIGLPIMDATFGAMGRRMALLTGIPVMLWVIPVAIFLFELYRIKVLQLQQKQQQQQEQQQTSTEETTAAPACDWNGGDGGGGRPQPAGAVDADGEGERLPLLSQGQRGGARASSAAPDGTDAEGQGANLRSQDAGAGGGGAVTLVDEVAKARDVGPDPQPLPRPESPRDVRHPDAPGSARDQQQQQQQQRQAAVVTPQTKDDPLRRPRLPNGHQPPSGVHLPRREAREAADPASRFAGPNAACLTHAVTPAMAAAPAVATVTDARMSSSGGGGGSGGAATAASVELAALSPSGAGPAAAAPPALSPPPPLRPLASTAAAGGRTPPAVPYGGVADGSVAVDVLASATTAAVEAEEGYELLCELGEQQQQEQQQKQQQRREAAQETMAADLAAGPADLTLPLVLPAQQPEELQRRNSSLPPTPRQHQHRQPQQSPFAALAKVASGEPPRRSEECGRAQPPPSLAAAAYAAAQRSASGGSCTGGPPATTIQPPPPPPSGFARSASGGRSGLGRAPPQASAPALSTVPSGDDDDLPSPPLSSSSSKHAQHAQSSPLVTAAAAAAAGPAAAVPAAPGAVLPAALPLAPSAASSIGSAADVLAAMEAASAATNPVSRSPAVPPSTTPVAITSTAGSPGATPSNGPTANNTAAITAVHFPSLSGLRRRPSGNPAATAGPREITAPGSNSNTNTTTQPTGAAARPAPARLSLDRKPSLLSRTRSGCVPATPAVRPSAVPVSPFAAAASAAPDRQASGPIATAAAAAAAIPHGASQGSAAELPSGTAARGPFSRQGSLQPRGQQQQQAQGAQGTQGPQQQLLGWLERQRSSTSLSAVDLPIPHKWLLGDKTQLGEEAAVGWQTRSSGLGEVAGGGQRLGSGGVGEVGSAGREEGGEGGGGGGGEAGGGAVVATGAANQSGTLLLVIRAVGKNPLLWSLVAALVVNLSGLRAFLDPDSPSYVLGLGFVAALLEWYQAIAVPVSLLSIGVWMYGKRLRRELLKQVSCLLLLKVVALPLLQAACGLALRLPTPVVLSLVLLALCPTATTSFVLAAHYGHGTDVVSAVTLGGTLLLVPAVLATLQLPRAFGVDIQLATPSEAGLR